MESRILKPDSRLEALDFIEVPLWIFDVDQCRIPWANSHGLRFWGARSTDELASRDMSIDMSISVKKRLSQYQTDCAIHQLSYKEFWTVYPKGTPRSAEAVFSPYRLPDNRNALLIQLLFEDVEVTSSSLHSTQALMHTSSMISLYGPDLELKYSNPAARSVAVGDSVSLSDQLVHSEDIERIAADLESEGHCEIECEVDTIEGRVWHALSIQLSPDSVNGETSILVSATDVTERRQAQQQALRLAYTDSLTGLRNRIALLEEVDELIRARVESQAQFAILFLDLDRFKLINDSLGHSVGDELLIHFSETLRACIKEEDVVARLGGDEFVVLIRDFEERSDLVHIVNRILERTSHSVVISGHKLRIVPSTGISVFPDHGDNITSLLQHADLAMYAVKGSSDRYQFFEPEMGRFSRDRLALENDLATALENGQFELYYQPKISAETGCIAGVEALVRWNHPERGLVSPLDFIPVAEETGMIIAMGLWVLQRACLDQVSWQKHNIHIPVSINISPKQMLTLDFAESVIAAIEQAGNDATMIELEITESVLIEDQEFVLGIMHELHDFGVKFSIDDFGTGYSNLAYLQRYPLDTLKVDKSFLRNTNDTALLEIILGMAKILRLKIVGEGVETLDQARLLIENECDELQGFFFSKPLPYARLVDFIENFDTFPTDLTQVA